MVEPSVEHHYVATIAPAFDEYADLPVFRPYLDRDDLWDTVTYRQLQQQLSVAQAHWKSTLALLGLKPLDVVGFWLTGRKLSDFVNTVAVSSLGYTPQFFSTYFPGLDVVLTTLAKAGGKLLIIDPSLYEQILDVNALPIPHFPSLEPDGIATLVAAALAAGTALTFTTDVAVRPDDVAALFHSSGTTGGMPKIIPNTFKMLRAVLRDKFARTQFPVHPPGVQIVWNSLGSLAHIGSFQCLIGAIGIGACMAQTSSMAVRPRELVGLARVCGMTILVMYATFLADLIRAAQADKDVEAALKSMKQITHTGVALNKEDEDWAYANGLNINTSYGTTETGPLMWSRLGTDAEARALRPIRGARAVFLPQSGEAANVSGAQELYELVVPQDADDCPPAEFCAADGYYHTQDLFEKSFDGWVYRGRAGDWIKVLGGFVDTKNIEDYVRKACVDLIHDAVVVGSGRKVPALIVELPSAEELREDKKKSVAEEVVKQLADLNASAFPHERVDDPTRVFVVARGVLPRTKEKGNVRRAVAEDMFAKELDEVSGPRA